MRTAAAAQLLFAVPHIVFHLRHADSLDGVDAIVSPLVLASTIVVAVMVLVASRVSRARTA